LEAANETFNTLESPTTLGQLTLWGLQNGEWARVKLYERGEQGDNSGKVSQDQDEPARRKKIRGGDEAK